MSFESETLKEITPRLGRGGIYYEISLLYESDRCRLYSALREGRRFILKTAAESSGKAVEMLKREYELSLTLSHPGLAYVFTYEESSQVGPCIVMEYVDGLSLDKWLETNPSLPKRRNAFIQLLDVVEYIHSHGVVHNDLAPQNILISRADDRVKLIDFGFADDGTHYLQTNLGCTKAYASAELLRGEAVDARSDIWSVGLLMRDFFGNLRYRGISSKCTRRNPALRYRSVAAVRTALNLRHIFPFVIATVAILSVIAGGLLSQRRSIASLQRENLTLQQENLVLQQEKRQRLEAEAYKDSVLTSLKDKVNLWYAENVATATEKMASEPDFNKKLAIRSNLIDSYNALWNGLVAECPEEYSSEFINWLVLKFNKDFPLQ